MENTEKSAAPAATGAGGAKDKVEKQARQLAYDVRYKVRQSLKAQAGGKSDPAAVRKAYMGQLAKSPSNPAVKTRAKQMLMGEGYIDVDSLVAQGAASAMYKVFVEHHQTDSDGNVIPHEETSPLNNGHKNDITEDKAKEKTYKVRVTDKESGNSYVRNATRAKIAELRNNPNISSVEMTEYGEPTRSEKHKGSQTASVKAGKGVGDDKEVAKENYTWKDAFGQLIEKTKNDEGDKKITGKGVNNSKLIKVFPDEVKEGYGSKKKKKKVAEDAEYGYDKEGNSLNPEDIKKKNEKDPNGKAKKEDDEDGRSMGTKWNLVKNRLRSMGLNMSQEPEGETIEEAERTLASRMDRKSKLYDKTTKKAMQFARDEGEASGHARFNMSRLGREKDKLAAKRREANEAYDNTKSPDYDKKKKALAKKHGGADKVKGHPQYESTVQTALDSLDSIPAKKN